MKVMGTRSTSLKATMQPVDIFSFMPRAPTYG